jgi:hypothetical protein
MRSREFSDEELIEDIKRVANKLGESPTQEEYNKHGAVHAETVARLIGSWNSAKERAGLDTFSRGVHRGNHPWGEIKQRYKTMKEHLPCESCGDNRRSCAMHFHHINPEQKTMGISKMVQDAGVSWERVVKEMEKCSLVCASCHEEIEAGVREEPINE